MPRARIALLGAFLLSGAATPAGAQHRGGHLYLTPVAGLNFATWTGSDVGPGATRRTGLHAGAMVSGDLGRLFTLQSGLLYSQEGTGADLGGGVTGTFKVDYLRIPLLLKLRMELSGSRVRPYVLSGPAFGVKVRCRIEASDGSTTVGADCGDPSVGLSLTSGDFAWVFGLGLDIGRVTLGGRYQLGLKSIDDTGSTAADVKNSLLAITAGYSF